MVICKQQKRLYIGIDPGKQGGLVIFAPSIDRLNWTEMPATEVELWAWFASLPKVPTFAVLEKVNSDPNFGRAASFTFGMGYGCLTMALIAAKIPFTCVQPKKWQATLNVSPRRNGEPKNKFKERLCAEARRLFPDLSLWEEAKCHQMAVCDALLLAHYARTNY